MLAGSEPACKSADAFGYSISIFFITLKEIKLIKVKTLNILRTQYATLITRRKVWVTKGN